MPKVLVAEDDRGTRTIVRRILESMDGGSAYNTAVEEKPDIILLDVWMPVMDGFDVLKKLRSHPDTELTPVILMTSLPAETGEPVGKRLGVRHYMTKPLDPGVRW